MRQSGNRMRAAAVAAAFTLGSGVALAQGGDVGVTLNGAPLALNPAPVERAGRVFVPLRGVFEHLGASVVYENGTINAQSRNHAVSLHIGSTQATVDGQAQTLDVAPFIVGASTYVPLRFVSQALGAIVNYDGTNRIVALATTGGPPPQRYPAEPPAPPPAAPPQHSALELRSVSPGRDATIGSRRPTIEAQFGGIAADPNTIRVSLDGLNVTDDATRSPNGVVFSPPSDLQSEQHTVRIVGRDANGAPFDRSWTFTSGVEPVRNMLEDIQPADGTTVGHSFVVRGRTLPNARVVVQVGTIDRERHDVIGVIFAGSGPSATVRNEVTADGAGRFETPIQMNVPPGQPIRVVIYSTSANGGAAPRVQRDLTVQ